MSPRSSPGGSWPARYHALYGSFGKVHLAQRLLETATWPIEAVPHSSGFCRPAICVALRGSCVQPAVYRHGFRPAPAPLRLE